MGMEPLPIAGRWFAWQREPAARGTVGSRPFRTLTGRLALLLGRTQGVPSPHAASTRRLRPMHDADSLGPSALLGQPRVTDSQEPALGASSSDAHAQDLALVKATLAGDREALDRFASRMVCIPRILQALNLQSGSRLDEHALADTAQDCALIVWRKLASYRPSHALEGWVYGIVLRELLNARRRRARASRVETLTAEHAREEPSEDVSDANEIELDAALDELSEGESAIIRLRHHEELSFPEIGRRLAIPENTAKTRYHRGLVHLRELLHVRSRQREHRS